MVIIKEFMEIFLHLDKHLFELVSNYNYWTYLFLFIVIFCETGLVVMPFLPGDTLLFVAGAVVALGVLNIWVLVLVLCVASLLGDTVNYSFGNLVGKKIYIREYRFVNKKHLIKTNEFFEKHGGKTIILARFIPVVRTFAPFVAGAGAMNFPRFISFSVVGSVVWVFTCVFTGYFFGNMDAVKNNFSTVVLVIVFIPLIPVGFSFIKKKLTRKKAL
jgi:membrane-associated protein